MIGEDFKFFRPLAKLNSDDIPARAVLFQSAVAVIFVLTSSFESILVFSGFALALNNFFAVLGIFILRNRFPELPRPYKTWLYPIPPILFLMLIGWTLFYILRQRPEEALVSLLLIITGAIVYFLSNRNQQNSEKSKSQVDD